MLLIILFAFTTLLKGVDRFPFIPGGIRQTLARKLENPPNPEMVTPPLNAGESITANLNLVERAPLRSWHLPEALRRHFPSTLTALIPADIPRLPNNDVNLPKILKTLEVAWEKLKNAPANTLDITPENEKYLESLRIRANYVGINEPMAMADVLNLPDQIDMLISKGCLTKNGDMTELYLNVYCTLLSISQIIPTIHIDKVPILPCPTNNQERERPYPRDDQNPKIIPNPGRKDGERPYPKESDPIIPTDPDRIPVTWNHKSLNPDKVLAGGTSRRIPIKVGQIKPTELLPNKLNSVKDDGINGKDKVHSSRQKKGANMAENRIEPVNLKEGIKKSRSLTESEQVNKRQKLEDSRSYSKDLTKTIGTSPTIESKQKEVISLIQDPKIRFHFPTLFFTNNRFLTVLARPIFVIKPNTQKNKRKPSTKRFKFNPLKISKEGFNLKDTKVRRKVRPRIVKIIKEILGQV